MNLTQLKTFCSVARTKSFTASAAELMISQPAVSRQIAGLEEEICARYASGNGAWFVPVDRTLVPSVFLAVGWR